MKTDKIYRCMVVDDEPHAIELLADYIAATPGLDLVRTYEDPVAALMENNTGEQYDFIFLDIDMPRLSGLELAKILRPSTAFLVFTTAHPHYALEAFEIRADHFLLKPISMSKFAVTVSSLLQNRESLPAPAVSPDHSFFIKTDQKNKLIKIDPLEIVAVEGLKNYVRIHTLDQKHIAYLTLKEIEEALRPTDTFIRVHKSFIMAKPYIEGVEGRRIMLRNNLEVPVGDTYRQLFTDYMAGRVLLSGR